MPDYHHYAAAMIAILDADLFTEDQRRHLHFGLAIGAAIGAADTAADAAQGISNAIETTCIEPDDAATRSRLHRALVAAPRTATTH